MTIVTRLGCSAALDASVRGAPSAKCGPDRFAFAGKIAFSQVKPAS
jgi:hypothetical protein